MTSDTHHPGANDLAPPASPLSRYSSATDTNQDEVSPLPLGLEISRSSPLLAGEHSGLAPTQVRRRNLQPRNTAPPGQPAPFLASQDDTPASHCQFVPLGSGSGMFQTDSSQSNSAIPRTQTVSRCWVQSVGGNDLSFMSYIASDLNFKLDQPSNSLFGETTRDKLYNSLFFVGPHLERFMFVGMAKCLDSLLGVMLVMPLQAVTAILSYVRRSQTYPLHSFHIIIFAVWACSCVAMTQVKVRDIPASS